MHIIDYRFSAPKRLPCKWRALTKAAFAADDCVVRCEIDRGDIKLTICSPYQWSQASLDKAASAAGKAMSKPRAKSKPKPKPKAKT